MADSKEKSKKITIGLVISWMLGIIFLIAGISSIAENILAAVILIIMSLIVLPPINNFIDKKYKFQLSGGLKVIIIIICLVIFGTLINEEKQDIASNNVEKNEANETILNTENSEVIIENIEENEIEIIETTSQRSAVRQANTYLRVGGFSRSGLIEQLKFEGFSDEDSIYGVDNIDVNWNEQASKKAESYLNISGYSRSGLIEQLKFEGFTTEQANYGADSVGL